MIWRSKSRAKKLGIAFNIVASDIVLVEVCPVLGIKIDYDTRQTGYRSDAPSIDRIKPELGYTKGNVRVISARANMLKNNASLAELRLILEDAERLS